MKAHDILIDHLKTLGKEEAKRQLESDANEIKSFTSFLYGLAGDTNDPETYNELLHVLSAYSVYGLEMIAEEMGIKQEPVNAAAYREAVSILKAEEEELQPN